MQLLLNPHTFPPSIILKLNPPPLFYPNQSPFIHEPDPFPLSMILTPLLFLWPWLLPSFYDPDSSPLSMILTPLSFYDPRSMIWPHPSEHDPDSFLFIWSSLLTLFFYDPDSFIVPWSAPPLVTWSWLLPLSTVWSWILTLFFYDTDSFLVPWSDPSPSYMILTPFLFLWS